MEDAVFKRMIIHHWRRHGRHDLPWRHTADPYRILVSEVMLQQTQVARVINYYHKFLRAFPSFRILARATPASVLKVWQGLGYNRRALMLLRCAKVVADSYQGKLPQEYESLRALPGIGPYTASAVLAFAFNRPVPMIETNIRRVYIHHFFPKRREVFDATILPFVTRHLSLVSSPRDWYSALMDYGAWLATQTPNPNRKSAQYARQSKFEGSDRQVRGAIIRVVLAEGPRKSSVLMNRFDISKRRFLNILAGLERDGLVVCRSGRVSCA